MYVNVKTFQFCFALKVFPSREELIKESLKMAEIIASKSPVAIQATKRNLVYSLDHTNQEGLDHIVSFFFLPFF